jgi:hypothetical protein
MREADTPATHASVHERAAALSLDEVAYQRRRTRAFPSATAPSHPPFASIV